jgi:hypothetical protein
MIGKGYNAFLSAIKSVVGSFGDWVHVPYSLTDLNSIMAYMRTSYQHVHGQSFLFPKYEAPKTLTSSAAAWSLTGTPVEIIGAEDTDRPFDLHWGVISSISDVLEGVITLYADDVEICAIPVSRTTNFSREEAMPLQVPQQPAGTVITAMFADSTTSARTVGLKVMGHYYG